MLIKAKVEEKKEGAYVFNATTKAIANDCLDKAIFQEIWNGFCCHKGKIEFENVNSFTLKIGEASLLCPPENGYVMEISETGISIVGSDDKNLVYGFFSLLERIRPICTKEGKEKFLVDCCRIEDSADVQLRIAHLCVFPETTLAFMRRFIRLVAFLRYTHIIVEFWGTLKFDCLKELAWKEAYSKSEIRPIFQEAQELGLQIIPMFNHWGHATGCRVKTGKHVVLDQNLTYAPLFSRTGWEWNLDNPEVVELHKNIRKELIELCGEGEYFHIGCDEAYSAVNKEDYESVVNYINEVSKDLEKKGRKTIMWGDMLLHASTLGNKIDNSYLLMCPSAELQKVLLDKLSRSVIIADWEYWSKKYPIETAVFFKEKGFEVLCCPWDLSAENIIVSASTIKANELLGVIHTTWQSINSRKGMWALAYSAALNWGETVFHPDKSRQGIEIASVLRKLDFPNGNYENSGWMKNQIGEELS